MICKKCGDQHDIPHVSTPEMGRCIICLEYRPLYPVKREQAPEVSPWVLVEERLPEIEELVMTINHPGADVRLSKIRSSGFWFLRTGVTMIPWMWCPIPPLPEIDG